MKAVVRYNPQTDKFDIFDEDGRWWGSHSTKWYAKEAAKNLEERWAEQDTKTP